VARAIPMESLFCASWVRLPAILFRSRVNPVNSRISSAFFLHFPSSWRVRRPPNTVPRRPAFTRSRWPTTRLSKTVSRLKTAVS